jgi:predicted transcriptional regulator
MTGPLEQVRKATRGRKRTETQYRAAIVAARAAGHTLREIGEAAGITEQGVRHLLIYVPKGER